MSRDECRKCDDYEECRKCDECDECGKCDECDECDECGKCDECDECEACDECDECRKCDECDESDECGKQCSGTVWCDAMENRTRWVGGWAIKRWVGGHVSFTDASISQGGVTSASSYTIPV